MPTRDPTSPPKNYVNSVPLGADKQCVGGDDPYVIDYPTVSCTPGSKYPRCVNGMETRCSGYMNKPPFYEVSRKCDNGCLGTSCKR